MNRTELLHYFTGEYARMKKFVSIRISDSVEIEPDEVVHDVILRILERSEITVPLGELAAYITTALRNRIIDLWRSRNRRGDESHEDIDGFADQRTGFIEELERNERFDLLEEAMDLLNDNERAVVEATELDGFTYKELEQMWSVSAGTLMSRKKRALDKMREYCKEADHD